MSDLLFVGSRTKNIMRWDKFITSKNWFESNISLTKGAVRGKFRTKLAPHTVRILQEIDKTHVNVVTIKVASQLQKTTVIMGMIMKWTDTDYHDMFLMLPRATDIKKFLEFKVKPMIEGTSSVKYKLKEYRQEEKARKHSHFYQTAQNLFAVISINDTKSITTKYGVFDEIAEFPPGIINEALERMKEYGDDYKAVLTSTQIHKNDEINHFFNISEVKLQYLMRCPHCIDLFYPTPNDLKFISIEEFKKIQNIDIKDDLTYDKIMSDYKPMASRGAFLECPICNSKITNKQRVDAILDGLCEWRQVVAISITDEIINWEISKNPKKYYESVGLDVNTVLAPRVPLKKLAEREIEALHADPHMQDMLYKKLRVGYWNTIYTPTDNTVVKKSEMLQLSNGYELSMIPPNTYALHVGVDLQKDRLYYTVIALEYAHDMVAHVVEYGELYSNGEGQDLRDLALLIDKKWEDNNGKIYLIESVGCDIRGFSQTDPLSRSSEMLDFIFDYAVKLRGYGLVNWDSFIYPMYGVAKFNNKAHEAQGFQEVAMKRKITIDGVEEEVKISALAFSNTKIKTMFFNMIARTIDKAKSVAGEQPFKYDRLLLYVTKEMTDRANERENLTYHEKREKHSIEAHFSSEHLTYKVTNGKPARIQTFEKKYSAVRNDYLDCVCMAIAQSLKHDTYRVRLVNKDVFDTREDLNKLKKALSIF